MKDLKNMRTEGDCKRKEKKEERKEKVNDRK